LLKSTSFSRSAVRSTLATTKSKRRSTTPGMKSAKLVVTKRHSLPIARQMARATSTEKPVSSPRSLVQQNGLSLLLTPTTSGSAASKMPLASKPSMAARARPIMFPMVPTSPPQSSPGNPASLFSCRPAEIYDYWRENTTGSISGITPQLRATDRPRYLRPIGR
jgi:hypothetical protein